MTATLTRDFGTVRASPPQSAREQNEDAAAAAIPGLELALITDRAAFDALEAAWNDLFARAGRSDQLFQAFNWNWHWASHFLKPDGGPLRLAIVTGRREGRLVMIWPLVVERVHGLRTLAWMGEPVSQYGDVLVEPGPAATAMLRAAWAFVRTALKPDLARLNKTRADAAIAPLLAEMDVIVTQRTQAPYVDLASAPTWAAYEERYSAKARKNRRRLQRRLEEQGAVTLSVLPEGAAAAEIVGKAIDLKRLWLADKGLVSPALTDARTLAFFTAIAADTGRPVQIRVSALTCGGRIAAAEIAFACRERMAIHIMAYDLEFDNAAAGILLLEQMLGDSLAAGVATYDLMAPGDGYKKEWADGAVGVSDLAIPLTLAGQLYARGYLAVLRPRLKAAVTRLPMGARKALSRRLGALVLLLGGVG